MDARSEYSLVYECRAVFFSPMSSFTNLGFYIIAYIHSSVGPQGFPSVLGYVCTVEVRLEGPALKVATMVRTKVYFIRSYHFLHAGSLSSDLNGRTDSISTHPPSIY